MGIILLWLILSIFVSSLSKSRRISFITSLLICLIFSPLIGILVILLSKKKSEMLNDLKVQFDSGSINEEEYNKEVRKIKPNKEDRNNMMLGYGIVIGVGLIIYLIMKFI